MFRKKGKYNNLSIEEMERVLKIKQREARQERFIRLSAQGVSNDVALLRSDDPLPPSATESATPQAAQSRTFGTPKMVSLKDGQPVSGKPKPKRLRDRLLMVLEVAAVIGLVAVLVASWLNLKELNQEVVEARDTGQGASQIALLPTESELAGAESAIKTSQPNLGFDRLPGGHSSPTSEGGAVPDIPAHLQTWVQPAPAVPVPKQSAAVATRIVIPKLNVDAPIIGGVTWEDLKKGVGHLPGSAQPGERGNLYLAAHNDIFGEIFRHLDDLDPGDEYHIYAGGTKYTYVVREKRIIDPTEVSVMLPTTEPVATLQTCYPYLIDTHRLVVVGDLVQ